MFRPTRSLRTLHLHACQCLMTQPGKHFTFVCLKRVAGSLTLGMGCTFHARLLMWASLVISCSRSSANM